MKGAGLRDVICFPISKRTFEAYFYAGIVCLCLCGCFLFLSSAVGRCAVSDSNLLFIWHFLYLSEFYQAYEKNKRLREIQNLYESGEQGTGLKNAWMESTLAGEFFVRNAKAQDEDYFRIIGKLCSEMQALENKMTASYREMIDYFTVWVHQVKTPIASMKLQLEGEDTGVSRRLTRKKWQRSGGV